MTDPKIRITFACDQCGDVVEITGKLRNRWEGRMPPDDVDQIDRVKFPDGWQRVGDKMYCDKHKIEIRKELKVDGVVIQDLSRPWGER